MNALLKDEQQTFETMSLDTERFIEMIGLIETGTLSGKMGKQVLEQLVKTNEPVQAIVDKCGGSQISDQSALEDIVRNILANNMDVVEKIKAGKTNSANFLMGQVMKETKGRANPDIVRQLILDLALKS